MSGFGTIAGNVGTRSGDFVGIGGDRQILFEQDVVTRSLADIGHPHEDIHEGEVYYVSDFKTDINSGLFVRYLVQTSTTMPHMLFGVNASPGVIIRLWENPTVTSAGIALTTINRSRVSGVATVTTVYISGVITSGTGTLLEAQVLGNPAAGAGAAFTPGFGGTTSQDRNENEYVLKISGSYLLETITLSSGTNINNQFRWYEETAI